MSAPVDEELGARRPGSRRGAREQAVFVLYQHDLTGLPIEQLERNAARQADAPLDRFARELIAGVSAELAALDEAISAATIDWTADRLAPLERNILRVAVHELRAGRVPAAIAINEAVELAKRYCQAEAGGLVNGVLGRIAARDPGGGG